LVLNEVIVVLRGAHHLAEHFREIDKEIRIIPRKGTYQGLSTCIENSTAIWYSPANLIISGMYILHPFGEIYMSLQG
jgi:hypothetical protein